MNKNRGFPPREHDIGCTGEIWDVHPEPVAH
jgi:hypothetical protein